MFWVLVWRVFLVAWWPTYNLRGIFLGVFEGRLARLIKKSLEIVLFWKLLIFLRRILNLKVINQTKVINCHLLSDFWLPNFKLFDKFQFSN
jgi:hypothetical protein